MVRQTLGKDPLVQDVIDRFKKLQKGLEILATALNKRPLNKRFSKIRSLLNRTKDPDNNLVDRELASNQLDELLKVPPPNITDFFKTKVDFSGLSLDELFDYVMSFLKYGTMDFFFPDGRHRDIVLGILVLFLVEHAEELEIKPKYKCVSKTLNAQWESGQFTPKNIKDRYQNMSDFIDPKTSRGFYLEIEKVLKKDG